MSQAATELAALYSNKSKHSNYQILPSRLRPILDPDSIETTTRFEQERLRYLLAKIPVAGRSILDIGGNTGFFGLESLAAGALSVRHIEGNQEHARFVALAAEMLGLSERLDVVDEYFPFDGSHTEHYDVALLLNVLHHVGDDYGSATSIADARKLILRQLDSLSTVAETLVLQLGFNWRGDRSRPLFAHGTKSELIEFIADGSASWEVAHVGIAVREGGGIVYLDAEAANLVRDDSLGEFLNRPLFVLRSKQQSSLPEEAR